MAVYQFVIPKPVQVYLPGLKNNLDIVSASIIGETGMQWLVQVSGQMTEPRKGLPPLLLCSLKVLQFSRVVFDSFSYALFFRTIPRFQIGKAATRNIDVVERRCRGTFVGFSYFIRPVTGC